MDRLYIILKRKLQIKVVPVTDSTFIKPKYIGKTIFFTPEAADDELVRLKLERYRKCKE